MVPGSSSSVLQRMPVRALCARCVCACACVCVCCVCARTLAVHRLGELDEVGVELFRPRVPVCVRVCVCASVCASVCVREPARASVCASVCVCVCVWVKCIDIFSLNS